MQGGKKISVGDTVWALWPGSRMYYEAKVLDVDKTTVQVDFKDGFTTEVASRHVYVRLISDLLCIMLPMQVVKLRRAKANHRGLPRSLLVILKTNQLATEVAILIALLLLIVFTSCMNFQRQHRLLNLVKGRIANNLSQIN